MTYERLTLAFALPLLLFSAKGHAEFGFSATTHSSHYKGKDGYLNLSPQYRGEKVNLDESSLSYAIKDSDKYRVELLGQVEARGYDSDSSAEFKGMDDRDPSLGIGGRFSKKTPYGELSATVTRDISSTHNGEEIDLRFGPKPYETPWQGKRELDVGFLAGVKWQSSDVIDYYYGVKPSEVTNTRSEYKGKTAITPYIGAKAEAVLSKHFTAHANVIYTDLPKEISDSPIVDGDNDVALTAGLTYWF